MLPELVERARDAFSADRATLPPLTLRGGCAVDGYDRPTPFDPALDEPTDGYLEAFAFWGLAYLDARSWRHYLPRLIEYVLSHPADRAMVAEALVRSLRPPDRYPPRLGSLSAPQEHAVAAFLELVARGDAVAHLRDDARQALEEWWHPHPRRRPTPDEIAEARRAPTTFRLHEAGLYRLALPETLVGSGVRDIPSESRRVETWGGYLHHDAHAMVAVNVSPLQVRSLADAVLARAALFREPPAEQPLEVAGARAARRLDGLTGDSPAEPQALTMVLASDGATLVTLSIRAWPRADVRADVERIVASFQLEA